MSVEELFEITNQWLKRIDLKLDSLAHNIYVGAILISLVLVAIAVMK